LGAPVSPSEFEHAPIRASAAPSTAVGCVQALLV